MKVPVQKLDETEIRRIYPLGDLIPGWFFRIREQSASVYRVEGTDLRGRQVSSVGTNEEILLAECVEAARRIQAQLEPPQPS